MNGREFLKRLRRLGKANGVAIRHDGKPGKGQSWQGLSRHGVHDHQGPEKGNRFRPVEQDALGPTANQG